MANELHRILHWLVNDAHPHLLFYTALLLIVLYKPPRVLSTFSGMADFLGRHFGDTIGFYFVHLGIFLQVIAGVYSNLAHIDHVGESLLLMGVGVLKMKYNPKETNGGNGNALPNQVVPAVVNPDLPAAGR